MCRQDTQHVGQIGNHGQAVPAPFVWFHRHAVARRSTVTLVMPARCRSVNQPLAAQFDRALEAKP